MPTYEYLCSNCEYNFDIYQPFAEEPIKKCPNCRSRKLSKVITGGIYGSVSKVETVGQLANKNAKKNKSKIQEEVCKKRESEAPAQKPWYDEYCSATTREINKMTDRQKINYIMRGEK